MISHMTNVWSLACFPIQVMKMSPRVHGFCCNQHLFASLVTRGILCANIKHQNERTILSEIVAFLVGRRRPHQASSWAAVAAGSTLCTVPRQFLYGHFVYDTSSTDISSTDIRLLLCTSIQDSYTSNFCFSKSSFSSIPTSTYTKIPFLSIPLPLTL